MMLLRWLTSRTVRQAVDLAKHANKLVRAQRDLLSRENIEAIMSSIGELRSSVASGSDLKTLREKMAELERVAGKHLKAYPNASIRENIEVILVAVAVALGIRTFILQPFKIPTGSMQPTLYGITAQNLMDQPDTAIPTGLSRWLDSWGRGVSYFHVIAEADGELDLRSVEPPKTLFPFVSRQRFRIGGHTQTIWFPPGTLPGRGGVAPHLLLFAHGGAQPGRVYRKGETILKLKVVSGDHLFVDRLTYNFRQPTRGEIIVFETRGIEHPSMPQDQFYIKRMVAMGNETVKIGEDRHLIINGERLDSSTPRFENVYSFRPESPPQDSHYSGHVFLPELAPLFLDRPEGFKVRPNHYMVMGDNTLNSFDSRAWGDFSKTNVIGKYCFVYWPFHSRFGWAAR